MNAFETRIRRRLEETAPCCTLSGVTLYRPDRFGTGNPYGYEIDNLLHWQNGGDDRLVVIECKDAPIEIAATRDTIPPENQEWYSRNPDGRKNLKDQLFNQAESIWQNLCVPPTQRRRIDAFIVSSAVHTKPLRCTMFTEHGLTMHVLSEQRLLELLSRPSEMAVALDTGTGGRFLRIAQSELLRLARQSVVVPELGHPEIDQAMELIRRCRQRLDGRLFDFFDPRERRWAINGAAGMGKSVLLAYTVTVVSTGKMLRDVPRDKNVRIPAQTELVDHADERLGLPPVPQRKILVVGLKPRQLDVLRHQWEQFHSRFMQLAGSFLPDAKPHFHKWQPNLRLSDYNVICIDEAHDLSPEDQQRIATWWNKDSANYLIIACDHHQKLRLVGAEHEKWMLNGVSFAGCSTRLKRNYRSPTPVYCAALGLMFRWFAPRGAKVVPTKEELEKGFGFSVSNLDRRKGGLVDLKIINDAHPANHWRYTVSRFTSCDAAYAWLSSHRPDEADVLWVRFGDHDHNAEHDAEDLKKRFKYKDLNSHDSHHTIDGEIKGREFPVVVIEGLPSALGTGEEWALRRQLYLCASRATAFLFFILAEETGTAESAAISTELDALIGALSSPVDPGAASSKTWAFKFELPDAPVGMDVFLDENIGTNDSEPVKSPNGTADGVVEAGSGTNPEMLAASPTKHIVPPLSPAAPVNGDSLRPLVEIPLEAIPHQTDPKPDTTIAEKQVAGARPAATQSAPAEQEEPLDIRHHKQIPRRVHEIAEAIGWEPRDLLEHINATRPNYQIKSVSWVLDWITAEAIIKSLKGRPPPNRETPISDQPSSIPAAKESAAVAKTALESLEREIEKPKPTLLPEREFQRLYGHVSGWKNFYRDGYLKTGEIPPFLRSHPKPKSVGQAQTPPRKAAPAQAVPTPLLTVRQLGQYLGLKPFHVIAALMPIKPNANPGDILDRKLTEFVCGKYHKTPPSHEQVLRLVSIPAPP